MAQLGISGDKQRHANVRASQSVEVGTANAMVFAAAASNYRLAQTSGRVYEETGPFTDTGLAAWVDCTFVLPTIGEEITAAVQLVKQSETVLSKAGVRVEKIAYSFESEGLGPAPFRVVWAALTEYNLAGMPDSATAYRIVTSPFAPDNRRPEEDVSTYHDPVLAMVAQLNAQMNGAFFHN